MMEMVMAWCDACSIIVFSEKNGQPESINYTTEKCSNSEYRMKNTADTNRERLFGVVFDGYLLSMR